MSEKEIVEKLNESFKLTRGRRHKSSDFKTIQDFMMEYNQMEVQDTINEIKNQSKTK